MFQHEFGQIWIIDFGFGLTARVMKSATFLETKRVAREHRAVAIRIYDEDTKQLLLEIRMNW